MEKKVAVGIPLSWTHVPSDFFFSYAMMEKPVGYQLIRASSGPIDTMRNLICRRAIELKCTHLIFLDADMVFPTNTITRLLQHDLDIVGGLCFKKAPPFDPTLLIGEPYKATILKDYPDDEVVEVTATGTACLLFNIDILEDMPYPWFKFDKSPQGKPVGEDVGFCYKARQLGYKVFVDTGVKTEHVTSVRVGESMYKFHRWAEKTEIVQAEQSLFPDFE